MRHGDTAVSHQLDEVAIRESIADVPAHPQFDNLGIEAAPTVDRVTRDRLGQRGLRPKDGTILCEARGCNRTLNYNPTRDFAPVSQVTSYELAFAVAANDS